MTKKIVSGSLLLLTTFAGCKDTASENKGAEPSEKGIAETADMGADTASTSAALLTKARTSIKTGDAWNTAFPKALRLLGAPGATNDGKYVFYAVEGEECITWTISKDDGAVHRAKLTRGARSSCPDASLLAGASLSLSAGKVSIKAFADVIEKLATGPRNPDTDRYESKDFDSGLKQAIEVLSDHSSNSDRAPFWQLAGPKACHRLSFERDDGKVRSLKIETIEGGC